MDKNELISSMLSFKDNIGMWKIVLNQITDADFVIGYGFDNNEKLWKVYQNNERGMKAEWTFENEEEALEKLYKKGNYSAPRLGYINFWSKQRKYNFCFIIALLRKVDNFSM